MKFILIAAALNLQITYPSQDICKQALDVVKEQDSKAFCIPAGEQKGDQMMLNFFDLIDKLQAMEQNKGLDKTPKP
jgi:hypothetical protein